LTASRHQDYGGHDEPARSDAPAEPLISAVRGGASLVRQPHFANWPGQSRGGGRIWRVCGTSCAHTRPSR